MQRIIVGEFANSNKIEAESQYPVITIWKQAVAYESTQERIEHLMERMVDMKLEALMPIHKKINMTP